jgi:carbonic anhydrase/acetyltransferase-like protein (isoleucine patch superfamily)
MKPIIISINGKTPRIHESAWIAPGAVVAGDVEIGPQTGIWYGVVIRTEHIPIRIGARTNIQDNAVVHSSSLYGPGSLNIGDEVTVGHGAILHHCNVGNRTLIGMGSIVLDGACLEDEAVVAAGTLVSMHTRVPARNLIIGNPGKIRRELTEEEINAFARGTSSYVEFRDLYQDENKRRSLDEAMPGKYLAAGKQ